MRIVKTAKLMSLSLLLAMATGATVVAQGTGSDGTSGSHHSKVSEATEVSSNSGADDTTTETTTSDDTSATHDANDDRTAKTTAIKTSHEAHLTAVKLKVCENRQKGITNIMGRISDRGQKQLNLFTSIATKTEAFYASKGKTLANYDALVAAVNDKKAAAQTTVDTVKADSASFSCSSTDPQGSIATFKTALKSEIQALKDYKTAVKNLIVGVKSVQSTSVPTTDTNQTEAN